jgi:hypothetical protein
MRNTGAAEYPLCARTPIAQIKGESNRRGRAYAGESLLRT